MDQFTQRIIGFGVHAGNVDGFALYRIFNTAISTQGVRGELLISLEEYIAMTLLPNE